MTEQDEHIVACGVVPTAPPTVPGEVRLVRPSVWPLVLGVPGMVWGFIEVLFGALTIESGVYVISEVGVRAFSGAMIQLSSVLLYIGSIGCVGRRGWARVFLAAWAIVEVLAALAFFGAASGRSESGVAAINAGFNGLALPAFVLFWLHRRSVKREMLAWRAK